MKVDKPVDLKPCPFCGEDKPFMTGYGPGTPPLGWDIALDFNGRPDAAKSAFHTVQVGCSACYATGPRVPPLAAIEAWNRRA